PSTVKRRIIESPAKNLETICPILRALKELIPEDVLKQFQEYEFEEWKGAPEYRYLFSEWQKFKYELESVPKIGDSLNVAETQINQDEEFSYSVEASLEPVQGVLEPVESVLIEPVKIIIQPVESVPDTMEEVMVPVEGVLDPLEVVLEPTEGFLEPSECFVQPAETLVEPTEGVLKPRNFIKLELKTLFTFLLAAASDEDGQKDVENSAKKQKIEENSVIENMDSFDDVEFSFCLDDGKINPDDFVKSMCEKEFHNESSMNHLLEDTFFPLEPNRETFFGLPMRVKDLLREIKGIDELYDWQIECLKLPAIEKRQNLIYTLPTSSGKTLVAEILILKELICHQRNVLFILPYVAVVKEKISSLAPFAVALDFLVEEYAGRNGECPPRKRRKKRSVYIATIEKSLSVINSLIEAGRLEEIGLVVIDELHLIGEKGRGASLETAITKIKFVGLNIQFVGMSATIGNIMEIEQFMEATTFAGNFRPVKLTEYIKCENDIYEVNPSNPEMFVPYRVIESDYDEKKLQIDPDHLGQLVMEVSPQDGVLIFCPTRQNCENVARLLANVLPEDFLQHRKAEKMSLLENMMKFFEYVCPILRKTIPYGIAYHHSGLVAEERRFLEEAFLDGTLCVICCTSTLAVGVNLPAKRVILRSPYIGREFITKSRYKQMVGRAGRVGMGTAYGDSIIILRSRDKPLAHDLFHSPMDTAKTSMHLCEFRGLSNLILSAISLGMATTYRQLVKLASMTLLAVQAEELSVVLRTEVEGIVKKFYKMNALWIKQESVPLDCTIKILTTQSSQVRNSPSMKKQIVIKSNSELEISNVGKAAVAACIDLDEAEKLYGELKKVQLGLVLVDYLHLLYIVTPTDVDLKMDPMILCDEFV
uniref:Helicase POLQ-like n=1 Tax=Phlebotomus papatasi TaxID=29031 RepID=A0A1B0D5R7_PHLPP